MVWFERYLGFSSRVTSRTMVTGGGEGYSSFRFMRTAERWERKQSLLVKGDTGIKVWSLLFTLPSCQFLIGLYVRNIITWARPRNDVNLSSASERRYKKKSKLVVNFLVLSERRYFRFYARKILFWADLIWLCWTSFFLVLLVVFRTY